MLLYGRKILHACGDFFEPYDYSTSFFLNDINNDPAFSSFYFTSSAPYYDYAGWGMGSAYGGKWMGQYLNCKTEDYVEDPNISEWFAYTKQKVSRADIDSFVYKFSNKEIAACIFHLKDESSSPATLRVKQNQFTKWLIKNKEVGAINYLVYAKKCEPLVTDNDYYSIENGGWRSVKRDTSKFDELVNEGLQLRSKTGSSFLKLRYTYQLLRLTLYNGRGQQTIRMFDQLIGNKVYDGIMYNRCLGLKAGAIFRSGDSSQIGYAAYLYSRVFERSDEMKEKAYISFEWCGEKSINGALKFCKNDHEKAVVYLMNALYEHAGEEREGLALMQKAYKLDPNLRGLDVVMTRELNKLEERVYPKKLLKKEKLDAAIFMRYPEFFAGLDTAKEQYEKYMRGLDEFARKVISDDKNVHKAYWCMTSAYLNMMLLNTADAEKQLRLATKYKMTTAETDEYNVIEALRIANSNQLITERTEEELLPYLKYIEHRALTSGPFNEVHHDMMEAILAAAYLHQKDTVKAIYCLSRSQKNFCTENGKKTDDWYSGLDVDHGFDDAPGHLLQHMRLDTIKTFILKKNKTAYEQWLTQSSYYTVDELNELDGTKYIRQHEFGKAAAVLAKVPKQILNEKGLPDPFAECLLDTMGWEEPKKGSNKYLFAKKMNELQKTIAAHPKDADAMYKYATGLYNIAYYGKAWSACEYYRRSTDECGWYASPDRKKLPSFRKAYYDAVEPEAYFVAAYKVTQSKGLKAKCLFMAAKCWQKRCPYSKDSYYDYSSNNPYYQNSLKNPYFKELTGKYGKTGFYDVAYNTCSYLRDYMRK